MATIETNIEGDVLIVSVTGALTAEETIAVIERYYPTGIIKDVIWDLTNGSLLLIDKGGFRRIAEAAKRSVANGSRQNGKTVYIGCADVEFGLLRMYTAIAEMTGVPISYTVYKTIDQAREWLRNGDS